MQPYEPMPFVVSIPAVFDTPWKRDYILGKATEFWGTMANWQVERKNPDSPPLSSEVKSVLVQGLVDLVAAEMETEDDGIKRIIHRYRGNRRAFRRTDTMPSGMAEIFTAAAASLLHDRIQATEQLQAYADDKGEVAYKLMGSVIGQALNIGIQIGINREVPEQFFTTR